MKASRFSGIGRKPDDPGCFVATSRNSAPTVVVPGSVKAVEGGRGYRQLTLAPQAYSANARAIIETRPRVREPSTLLSRERPVGHAWSRPCPETCHNGLLRTEYACRPTLLGNAVRN